MDLHARKIVREKALTVLIYKNLKITVCIGLL
jgi:hypothetical protein